STALDAYVGAALPLTERMHQQFEAVATMLGQDPALQQSCLALSATDSPLGELRGDAAQLRSLTAPPPLSAYQEELRQTADAAEELAQRVMSACTGGGDLTPVGAGMRV